MNRIQNLFTQKKGEILSIFFTAGYPQLEDTLPIIESLSQAGADLIEIGMPFSDPIADGPTIQASSMQALDNGMSIARLLDQLQGIRQRVDTPLLLMGYLNPVMQYGLERFVSEAAQVGIDGLILPDLPMYEYEQEYQALFEAHGLSNVFLITPQTSEARIRKIDDLTQAFIYMVSSDSTTGKSGAFSESQLAYFQRIQAMKLRNPRLIGFGISDHETFHVASAYAQGAIIGSAFIKALAGEGTLTKRVSQFIHKIKGKNQSVEGK